MALHARDPRVREVDARPMKSGLELQNAPLLSLEDIDVVEFTTPPTGPGWFLISVVQMTTKPRAASTRFGLVYVCGRPRDRRGEPV